MEAKRHLHIAIPPAERRPKRRHPRPGRWLAWLFLLAVVAAGVWFGWRYYRDHLRGSKPETPEQLATLAAESSALVPVTEPRLIDPFAPRPAEPAPAQPTGAPGAPATTVPATGTPATPAARPAQPPASPAPERDFRPRMPRDVFEAQIALARDAICPGSIDGSFGSQTRAAIAAFQEKHGLRKTGQLDNTTREALTLLEAPLATYTVTAADFLRLRPLPKGWAERAALDRLDYSTILELVAERHYTNPKQIKALNPTVSWENVQTGTVLTVPSVRRSPPQTRPDRIVIHLSARILEVFDADSRLLAHFPCSIGRRAEKRPSGQLAVESVAPDPDYTFDPTNFPDSAEAQRVGKRLKLAPGPNNPVGSAYIKLSTPEAGNISGFGIHGSPEPEQIGRTESAGCFRLANWNAGYLLPLVHPGMPVIVEP
jgi:lipoprotein-anchoring transpeptidase ErfK/SrfK